jgi:glycosyltransferase involved in cell wall biosynthesis
MMVTVIIPAYDAAQTIGRAIESVIAQIFPDFELLIIDDGSQDKTADLVLSIQDLRIKLLRHAFNQGAGSARNTGIRLAQGELIAFLDADDTWEADKLAVQVQFMHENLEFGASVTSFWYETEEGPSLQILHKPGSWIKELSKGCALSPGSTLMARKYCFNDVGRFDENMPRHEDFDWLLRFVQKFDLGVVQRPLATVYRSGQPSGEKIEEGNCILVERYRGLFYSLGRFRGSQAVGKRWLETSVHYFMFGNKRMGFSYLLRTIKENPFQRVTMYIRIIDYALGVHFFSAIKKSILKAIYLIKRGINMSHS